MNSPNILVVGGAGYIGGSLVADFSSRETGPWKDATIYASVRSPKQVELLSQAGINAIELNVGNEASVKDAILRHNIDIAINATIGFDPNVASNIIKALGERRRKTGKQVYIIQSSVLAVFSCEGGWTYGEVRDSDPLLEKERELGGPNPVRLVRMIQSSCLLIYL